MFVCKHSNDYILTQRGFVSCVSNQPMLLYIQVYVNEKTKYIMESKDKAPNQADEYMEKQRREFYEMRNKKYAEDNSRFKGLMDDQQSIDNLNMDSKDSKDIYTYNFHKKCITKIDGRLYREYFLDDGTPISPERFKDPAMRKVATCIYNGWVVSGKPVEKRECE